MPAGLAALRAIGTVCPAGRLRRGRTTGRSMMRIPATVSGLLLGVGLAVGLASAAAADTTSSASGAGASVSIISGSNGGTTIVVDSQHPCRTENAGTTASGSSSAPSTSTTTSIGAGSLSGSATAGAGGTSVQINPGRNGTMSSVSSSQNVASANECVIIVKSPSK